MSTSLTTTSAAPTQTKGMFFKHVVGDTMTLKRFVREALKDVRPCIKADPYLQRKLACVEEDAAEDERRDALELAYRAIDQAVAESVRFYLRNRSRNERVRAQHVSCVSATDLETRQARCIITVKAWGHMWREIIDLELPQP